MSTTQPIRGVNSARKLTSSYLEQMHYHNHLPTQDDLDIVYVGVGF